MDATANLQLRQRMGDCRKGRFGEPGVARLTRKFVNEQLSQNGLEVLPIHLRHALGVCGLPDHHRDPFDRLLVSQAVAEKLPILTADPETPRYPVETLW